MERTDELLRNLEIAFWPLERLQAYAQSARLHPDSQIRRLVASIDEFGFNNPLLVSPDGEIIAGHGRLSAALKLGLKTVPVIVLAHLSEAERRAFRIADNQLQLLASWDPELLRRELESLIEENFKIDLLGFTDEDLAEVLARETERNESDPDAVPAIPRKPATRVGDLWVMGNHAMLVGDGTQPENLAKVLKDQPCNMIFTDLPYNVNYSGKGPTRMTIVNDDLGSEFGSFLQSACSAMLQISHGAIYICMSSSELHRLHAAFTRAGGHWSTFVMWTKNTFTLGRSDYHRQYEPILYGWREGGTHYWCGDRDQSDVWFVDKPVRNDLHPTMKPVELIERAIRNSSKPGNVVLDPFAGSGSTLIACEILGRRARLVEVDPVYADVCVRRWQEYTQQSATLGVDGKCFEEIESERNAAAPEMVEAQ